MHGLTLQAAGDPSTRRDLFAALATAGIARLQERVPAERLRPKNLQLAGEIVACLVPFLTWLGWREFPERADPAEFRASVISLVQSFLLRDAPASAPTA